MSGIGNIGGTGLQQAQKLVQQAPAQLQEFDQVLRQLEQGSNAGQIQGQAVQQAQQQARPAQVAGPEQSDALYAQKLDEAKEPGGVRKLLGEVEAGTRRLDELIGQLDGGRTFSSQELLGLQAEIQQVSLSVETTTKVVSEVVSNVKQLMQQQI